MSSSYEEYIWFKLQRIEYRLPRYFIDLTKMMEFKISSGGKILNHEYVINNYNRIIKQ